jgi:hypothetical protein
VAAGVLKIQLEFDVGAKNSFFKANFDTGFDVVAAGAPLLATTTGLAAKETTKDIAKAEITEIEVNILAIKATEALKRVTTAAIAADTGVAELVVALALARVF